MKRRTSTLALGAALIVALVALGAWKVFQASLYERPDAAAGVAHALSPPPSAEPAREVEVLEVIGAVERTAPGGAWHEVARGDRLHADDAVRTSRTGRAELAVGAAARLTVAEGTQLHVREVTAAVHRFRLTRGRIAARYQEDGARVVRIEGADGDTAVEARSATFSVLAGGASLAVATETGTVQLRSAGAAVDVAAGRQAVATAGLPPSAPAPIPAELLLKVADARRVGAAELCAAVEGRAAPGAEVLVDGEPAPVGPDGRFSRRVPRRGRTTVVVVTRSADGRVVERVVPCRPEVVERVREFGVRWKEDPDG